MSFFCTDVIRRWKIHLNMKRHVPPLPPWQPKIIHRRAFFSLCKQVANPVHSGVVVSHSQSSVCYPFTHTVLIPMVRQASLLSKVELNERNSPSPPYPASVSIPPSLCLSSPLGKEVTRLPGQEIGHRSQRDNTTVCRVHVHNTCIKRMTPSLHQAAPCSPSSSL